jgi:glutamine amidotransferase
MVQLVLIDYGVGNVGSLMRSFSKVGASVKISGEKSDIRAADGLILPGVGAFGAAMEKLSPLAQTVIDETQRGKPMLGICLGLQTLFTKGLEGGDFDGLDIIKGTVRKFPDMGLKVPQIGWNAIHLMNPDHPLYRDIPEQSYVYFVHSYYADTADQANVLTTTDYGITYASSVGTKNIFATQFHPEKSGKVGLQILTNYLRFVKGA